MNVRTNIDLLANSSSPLHPIQELLAVAGSQCSVFHAGRDLVHGGHDYYDMLLIDRELPDISAIDVIRAVRAVRNRDVPIVIFGSDRNDDDMVEALDAGADDYVLRPLSARELLARIAALRRGMSGTRLRATMPLRAGPYELSNPGRYATLDGERIPMTLKEFDLAMLMFANAGRILASRRFEHTVWGHVLPPYSRALAGLVSRMWHVEPLRREWCDGQRCVCPRLPARRSRSSGAPGVVCRCPPAVSPAPCRASQAKCLNADQPF